MPPNDLPIHSGVLVGHVHLKVADLERALGFYRDVLGFEVTQRMGRQAAFLSAGGYHHHIGLNTWESAGGSPPAPGRTGLYHVALLYPTRALLADALRRVLKAGIELDGAADHGVSEALYLRDPDENGVELYWGSSRRTMAEERRWKPCHVHPAVEPGRLADRAGLRFPRAGPAFPRFTGKRGFGSIVPMSTGVHTQSRTMTTCSAILPSLTLSLGVLAFIPTCIAADSGIAVEQSAMQLRVTWPMSPEENGVAVFSLDEKKTLIESLWIAKKGQPATEVMNTLNPVTLLTVGSRDSKNPQGWGAFFDNTPKRPYETFAVALGKRRVQTTNCGTRTTVSLAEAVGGGFSGDVRFTFHRNSPLIHAEAVMKTEEDWRAIVYDAGLESPAPNWTSMGWNDTSGKFQSVRYAEQAGPETLAVAGRTIVASGSAGSLAVFPAPHQFFYPQDEAYNLQFVWHGWNYRQRAPGCGFGIRQSDTGDKRFVPWFNAPPGTEQRLGVFYLLTRGDGRQALEAVARYTHGDRFKNLPGYLTFTSHYHVEHSKNFLEKQKEQQTTGVPRGLETPGFVKTFKARGADIVHLAEFHYEDGSRIPETNRLHKLKVMHDECRRLSDGELLLLPGEEPNVHLGGHWLSLFPKPVNWTLNRLVNKPFVEEIEGHGKVYHVGSPADVLRLFEAERGLMWTAHPRIKSSFKFPDQYKDTEFFRSDRFLGGAWKAMPADLSRPTLGWRVLELLDDMSNWGAKKHTLGEVDTFRMEPDFETYAHMNINYLRLAKRPRYDDGWQPVLDALRDGSFFTTTGEVLIPEFTVGSRQSGQTLVLKGDAKPVLEASLDWTFPLAFAEIISGDGQKVHRKRIDLTDTESFGTRQLRLPLELKSRTWVRFEVWDIAANGAFTQPVWIGEAK